jgi:type II secretory pathway component PulJ
MNTSNAGRGTRGAVLLEVIAALTIFAFAAVGAISLLSQLSESQHRAYANERTVADEDRLLTAYSLLARQDLDLRLGRRTVGPYLVEIERPEPVLYRVTIGDSSGVDLATLLYRPEERRNAP